MHCRRCREQFPTVTHWVCHSCPTAASEGPSVLRNLDPLADALEALSAADSARLWLALARLSSLRRGR